MLPLRISPLLGLACLLLGGSPLEGSSLPAAQNARTRPVQDARRAQKTPVNQRKQQAQGRAKAKQGPARNVPKDGEAQGPSALRPLVNPLVEAQPLSDKEKLAMFDADKNNRLDPIEKLAAHKEVRRRKLAMDQILREYDADKNGLISTAETKAIMAGMAAQRRIQTEAKYDIDRDGRLEPEERAAMLRDLDRARAAMVRGEAAPPGSPKARAREAAAKRAQALQEAALFLQFDTDKDGKHSPAEAQAMAKFALQKRVANTKAAREARQAKNGKAPKTIDVLDPADLEPLPLPPDPNDPRQQMLKRFDLDGDGQFNSRERQAISQFYSRRKSTRPSGEDDTTKPAPKKRPKPKRNQAKGQQQKKNTPPAKQKPAAKRKKTGGQGSGPAGGA